MNVEGRRIYQCHAQLLVGYGGRGDAYLQHILFQNEMLPPELGDVALDCTTRWPIVVQPCYSIVDLEGGYVKQAPLQCPRLQEWSSRVLHKFCAKRLFGETRAIGREVRCYAS